jgi:hypothetical protein
MLKTAVCDTDIRKESFGHKLSGLAARVLSQPDHRAQQRADPCTGNVVGCGEWICCMHCATVMLEHRLAASICTRPFNADVRLAPADHRVQHIAGNTMAIWQDKCHGRRQWPHLPAVPQQDGAAADVRPNTVSRRRHYFCRCTTCSLQLTMTCC